MKILIVHVAWVICLLDSTPKELTGGLFSHILHKILICLMSETEYRLQNQTGLCSNSLTCYMTSGKSLNLFVPQFHE